jgi:endonuclease G
MKLIFTFALLTTCSVFLTLGADRGPELEFSEVLNMDHVKSTATRHEQDGDHEDHTGHDEDHDEEDHDEEDHAGDVDDKTYYISGQVADRRHAGTKNTIELQLENKNGTKTSFIPLGSQFKDGAKFGEKKVELADIGDPADIKLVRLKTNGGDGFLLKTLQVTTKPGKKSKQASFSPGKRFLMCRSVAPDQDDACTITLSPATDTGAHSCKECKAVLPPAPKALESDFKAPEHGHYMRLRSSTKINKLQYDGYAVWVDCSIHAAYRFEYMAYEDCGCHPRHHGFKLDPDDERVSRSCQQKNGQAYKKTEGVAFDRGHLVPANHLDHDADAITQSNYMTNILPQAALMNRGAWLESEELVECLRDKEPVHVLGGAVYDQEDPRYNWFQDSHYVKNPSFFWKVVTVAKLHKEDFHRIAFWFPNNEVAKRGTIGSYVTSLANLEMMLEKFGQPQVFDVPQKEKDHVPKGAWNHIKGCDKSLA